MVSVQFIVTVTAAAVAALVDCTLTPAASEHGNYEKSEYQQTKYPRYEMFKAITDVFRADGRAVPVFNDKHLRLTHQSILY